VWPDDHECDPPPNLVGHAALLTSQQHNSPEKPDESHGEPASGTPSPLPLASAGGSGFFYC